MEEETGAGGKIVFDVDGAAVFGDDARGDGEAEAGAAILGGEIRKKEFVLVLGRDALAGVGDGDFDVFGVGVGAGGDSDVADRRGFEGFGGVVNEIDDDAAEKSGIGANDGKIFGERGFERDAVEAAGENFDGFADDGVDVGGFEFGGREADEFGEFVDESGERADFALDEAGAFLHKTREFRVARRSGFSGIACFEVMRKALRRERDRREGILDFVGDAACDFLPGGGFLGAEEFGEVVENDDVTGVGAARAERADGDRGVKQAAASDEFEFASDNAHAERAAHEGFDRACVFEADELLESFGVGGGGFEDARDGGVGANDFAGFVERENAGGNVLENGFHETAATFEFLDRELKAGGELVDLRAGVAELRGHGVEGTNEDAEFVLSLLGDLILEIAGGDFAGGFGERLHGRGDLFGEVQGDPHEGGAEKKSEEEKNQEELALESAEMLLFLIVGESLELDFGKALSEVGGNLAGGVDGALTALQRYSSGDIHLTFAGPKLCAA